MGAPGLDSVLILWLVGVVMIDDVGDVVVSDCVVVHLLRWLAIFVVWPLVECDTRSACTVDDIVLVHIVIAPLNADGVAVTVVIMIFHVNIQKAIATHEQIIGCLPGRQADQVQPSGSLCDQIVC